MKQRKRFTIILALILASVALFACTPNSSGDGYVDPGMDIPDRFPAKYSDTAWRNLDEGYLLGDFEHEFEYMFLCIYGDTSTFGALKFKEKYATRGNQSLEITVYGNGTFLPGSLEHNYFIFYTQSGLKSSQYMETDWSDYTTLKFDLYSEMDQESIITFWLNARGYRIDFRVQPGANSIEIPLDAPTLAVFNGWDGVEYNDLSTVSSFGFQFQNYAVFNSVQTYYLDNLRLV